MEGTAMTSTNLQNRWRAALTPEIQNLDRSPAVWVFQLP
jgi:hypothetical protein